MTAAYEKEFIVSVAVEKVVANSSPIADIAQKILQGERISSEEALRLYRHENLLEVGALGEFVRRRKAGQGKERHVYYIHNMHLNPTNFCVETCRFCSYANPGNKAYTWTVEQVLDEARQGVNLGIKEIHMVGGLNPICNLEYYEEIMTAVKKEFPHLHLKAMTAVEIEYLANLEGISYEDCLKRLITAGLDSMPGGGAEIFDQSVREKMAVKKTPAHVWLEIHGIAHTLGIKTTATMLTGIGEGIEHKVDHMMQLRDQQDKTGGFMCFIPLKCYYEGTNIRDEVKEPTADDLLRDVAISRIMLDNFDHIKAYWIQLGTNLAQVALSFGADDMDGTILEEKITHAAGAQSPLQLAKERMEELISTAGYTPVERDTIYNIRKIGETPCEPSQALSERVADLIKCC
jgi:aminodeoxyfutalosine synthase